MVAVLAMRRVTGVIEAVNAAVVVVVLAETTIEETIIIVTTTTEGTVDHRDHFMVDAVAADPHGAVIAVVVVEADTTVRHHPRNRTMAHHKAAGMITVIITDTIMVTTMAHPVVVVVEVATAIAAAEAAMAVVVVTITVADHPVEAAAAVAIAVAVTVAVVEVVAEAVEDAVRTVNALIRRITVPTLLFPSTILCPFRPYYILLYSFCAF